LEIKTESVPTAKLSEDATDKTVTWSIDKPAVATVDATGKVTAVAEGEATITAKAGDKTATCKVTVNKKAGSISYATASEDHGDRSLICSPMTTI
jgi:uncharacterized protein YjdB